MNLICERGSSFGCGRTQSDGVGVGKNGSVYWDMFSPDGECSASRRALINAYR